MPSIAAQNPVDQANPPKPSTSSANAQNPAPLHSFLALPPDPPPEVVERGKRLYMASCAFCHGANAAGGESGPNLVRSVIVLHDKGTGTAIGPILLAGRTEKGMPKFSMTPDQVWDLAAFLLSRQNAAADRSTYHVEFRLSGDAARGKQYFASHCAACHDPVDSFRNLVQTKEPAQVQDLFLMPTGVKRQATVTLPSGESFAGELVQLDDFVVTIRDKSGIARSWTLGDSRRVRVEVTDPLQGHRDLLPKYSDEDIHDILAYLETLK
ncbi:MAG TPA: c-type cytochrome [Candidatus Acidoferrum sp.]|nr:c-type cytochrome [Candidatus Acidoferrum sp.]